MKSKVFILLIILLICVQIAVITFLFLQIQHKNNNTLGVSVNTIDSKTIKKTPSGGLKYFYEPKANSINKVNEWSLYQGVYTINSDSLNERFDYSVEKPEKTYRIITLGDSFTYGLYVDTKDNWSEGLEDLLNNQLNCQNFNKFEVINLAVHGYDIQYNVERFKKRGEKYKPDLVIWFIVDPLRITDKIVSLSAEIKDELRKNNDLEKINSYYPWRMAFRQIVKKFGVDGILNFQRSSLLEFNKLYQGPLFFVYGDWIEKSYQEAFDKYHKKNWSLTISIPAENHFSTDGHPNQIGHQKIAEDVFDYLTKNKLIPCN